MQAAYIDEHSGIIDPNFHPDWLELDEYGGDDIVISREDCMKQILEQIPDFHSAWSQYCEYWGDDCPGLCSDLTEFSDFVITLLQNNKHSVLSKIFSIIEHLMVHGDEEVKDAVATCFLENLLNETSFGTINANEFMHFLGTESDRYCKEWDDFTGVST
ncbi:MAG: hypothetical protein J7647_26845 [Cyanobacteria bacterium SBLK]|nr:hypothetical protein [Cyanobacteria bacterium SBLK]